MKARNLIALGLGGYAVGAVGSVVGMAAVLRRKYRGSGHLPAKRSKSILRGSLDTFRAEDIIVVPVVVRPKLAPSTIVVPYSDPRDRA